MHRIIRYILTLLLTLLVILYTIKNSITSDKRFRYYELGQF